jgi:NitT/TauT family transport system substrate-binding protein
MNARMNQWFVLLLVVLLCGTAQGQEKLQKVRIASGGHIVHFLPLDLAVALGYFKDEGLDPEITYLKGGTATAQALISKQVDFSTNSIDHAFKAAAQGKDDLRMVVLMNQTPGMVLVVDSKHKDKVKSITDLKGMRLGVTSKGSATNMVLAFLLSKNAVSLDDVTVVKAGSSTFPPALKNGDIDGGIALEPFASAMVENGDAFILQRLITMDDTLKAFGGPYNQAGILTRQEVIDNNRELVQKVTCVLVKALQFIKEHTSEEIAFVLSSEVTGSDKAQYTNTLDLLLEFYSPTGKIESLGVMNILGSMRGSEVLPNDVVIRPQQFYDNSFVLAARTSNLDAVQKTGVPDGSSTSPNYSLYGLILAVLLVPLNIWQWRHNKKLERQIHYVDFIEKLDEFSKAVLEKAESVESIFNLALPLPVLYAVQDSGFSKDDFERSQWWQKFSGRLIENLTSAAQKQGNSANISIKLVCLCDSQLRRRALELLKDDRQASEYVEVVDAFIEKLRSIPGVKVDADTRVFDLPFWSVIVDPHSERHGTAIVCFTDPEEVARMEKNGLSPEQIASLITGIKISERHAVGFFQKSFMDMKSRLYCYELIEQLKNDLKKPGIEIDMAFIHKWEDKLDESKEWYPHEVLVRSK